MSAGRTLNDSPMAQRLMTSGQTGVLGGLTQSPTPMNMTGMPAPNMALQAISAQPMPRQVMQPFQVDGYNRMQAISQMARPAYENFSQVAPRPMPVQNPVFGGNIPMSFNLPAAAQAPVQAYQPTNQFVPGLSALRSAYDQQMADMRADYDSRIKSLEKNAGIVNVPAGSGYGGYVAAHLGSMFGG